MNGNSLIEEGEPLLDSHNQCLVANLIGDAVHTVKDFFLRVSSTVTTMGRWSGRPAARGPST
jgi:hypothetical protein